MLHRGPQDPNKSPWAARTAVKRVKKIKSGELFPFFFISRLPPPHLLTHFTGGRREETSLPQRYGRKKKTRGRKRRFDWLESGSEEMLLSRMKHWDRERQVFQSCLGGFLKASQPLYRHTSRRHSVSDSTVCFSVNSCCVPNIPNQCLPTTKRNKTHRDASESLWFQ